MLPEEAWRSLYRDAADAVNLAVRGELAAGATILDSGLRLAAEQQGVVSWGMELADEYRRVLEGYCTRYGIALEDRVLALAQPVTGDLSARTRER